MEPAYNSIISILNLSPPNKKGRLLELEVPELKNCLARTDPIFRSELRRHLNVFKTRLKASVEPISPSPFLVCHGMVMLSINSPWNSHVKGSGRLLRNMAVGSRLPWIDQVCRLCPKQLTSPYTALDHIRKMHRPWIIHLICSRCCGIRWHLKKAIQHAIKSRPKKKPPRHFRP